MPLDLLPDLPLEARISIELAVGFGVYAPLSIALGWWLGSALPVLADALVASIEREIDRWLLNEAREPSFQPMERV